MPLILVSDEDDDAEGTAFVNALHDVRAGRAVVHAPSVQTPFHDELLVALERDDRRDMATGRSRRRIYAEAWLAAHEEFDLFVYGAWRVDERDLAALHGIARRALTRIWLICYPHAHQYERLARAADELVAFRSFAQRWKEHGNAPRQLSDTSSHRGDPGHPVPRLPFHPAPWPWGLVDTLVPRDACGRRCVKAANALTAEIPAWTAGAAHTVIEVARAITDLFVDWVAAADRAFALMVIRDALFQRSTWFEWNDALIHCDIRGMREFAWTRANRVQEPDIAAELLLWQLTASRDVSLKDCAMAPDGSSVLLPTGVRLAIPREDQPTLRAYLRAKDQRGPSTTTTERRAQQVRMLWDAFSEPERVRRYEHLASVAGQIDVRPLRRLYQSPAGPGSNVGEDARQRPGEPVELRFEHGLLLAAIRENDRSAAVLEPLPAWSGDRYALGEVQRAGLVVPGEGDSPPELVDWLRSLWLSKRVVPRP